PNPAMDDKVREVVVKPIGGEDNLRYRDWIEANRRYVSERSGGKVGYIYVPNTGIDGQSDLVRQFQGERFKPALIIDDRWNGGGQIPHRFIEMLNRPVTNYWARRDQKDWIWPPDSHIGPKAMMINGLAGSGGDMFPWLFRHSKLGPLVGTRTWGGLVGISGNPGMIDGSKDPWAAFQGLAGKTVSLTVGPNPAMDDKVREVVVKPRGGEDGLRYRDWIEANRRYVAEKSGGKVGYIYVPNTGLDGQSDLVRQFQGERFKQALIVDDRWNGGGQIPTRFIEMLNRPVTNYWARRDQADWIWPPDRHHAPKAMRINALAGSGGDMFPWLFRHNRLGPLVGTRTWGGLVGISGNPGMIDGSGVRVPVFAFYEKDGTWGIEGHGVDPDFEVLDDPGVMKGGPHQGGIDPQLDKAVELLLAELERNPVKHPARPAYPNREGFGIAPEDK
ncbi:MAG: S41 family peptidase, partial [Phycisphaerales bacterium]